MVQAGLLLRNIQTETVALEGTQPGSRYELPKTWCCPASMAQWLNVGL